MVRSSRALAASPAPPSSAKTPKPSPAQQASRGGNLFFLVLAVIGSLHVGGMLVLEGWRAVTDYRDYGRLSSDVAALEAERDALLAVVEYGDDPVYREALARCLGFVRPDEVRYLSMNDRSDIEPQSAAWCR